MMRKVGFGVAAGLAVAGAAAVKLGLDGIRSFSDLQENVSKTQAVFEDQAGAILEWASKSAVGFGLSKSAALGAVGTFGNMFDQLGILGGASKDMSTKMVELAADFGSFHNADITDVISAQSAAFRGEYDALQRFLPLINAATVEQEAMAMTGKKNAAELTAQEKALAVYELMVEGAGKATGDFTRTADGHANTMRILSATYEDVKASIGKVLMTELLPAFLEGLGVGSAKGKDLGETMAELAPKIERAGAAVADIARDIGTLIRVIADVIGWINRADNALSGFMRRGDRFAASRSWGPFGFGGGRQHGGPVMAGGGYPVGEGGPEMFYPSSSGTIVPNHALGSGGGDVHITLTLDGAVLAEVVRRHNRRDAFRGGR
jgi:hypothetical protein